jgi:two-component system chemotaxis response regulator CheY
MTIATESIRVMVVEDNDFVRELVVVMLREIGFREISEARDGKDALHRLDAVNPELIVCDIEMAPMDGLQFVAALRNHASPEFAALPVIFLTSHIDPPKVKQAAQLNVEAYVVKPVQKKQLEARVTTALERAVVRRR